MNYFAHGYRFVDDPYFLAGTAIPDWLNVVDRRVRIRLKHAQPFVDDDDPRLAAVARGIVQHHTDDDWFHQTSAFAKLFWSFTAVIRDALAPDPGMRPSFLGHILVELLLDAELIEECPDALERYYAAIESVDPQVVQDVVNRMAPRPTEELARLIPAFVASRFLFDYSEDRKLLRRLNGVMARVRLSSLPESFMRIIPDARGAVSQFKSELLTPPANV